MIFKPKDINDISKELKKVYDGKNLRLALASCPLIDEYLKTFKHTSILYDWKTKVEHEIDSTDDAIHSIRQIIKSLNGNVYVVNISNYGFSPLMGFLLRLNTTKTLQYVGYQDHLLFGRKPFKSFYVGDGYVYIQDKSLNVFFVTMETINKYFFPKAYKEPDPDLSLGNVPRYTKDIRPFVAKAKNKSKKTYKRNQGNNNLLNLHV